jgi:hypothetical protein
MPPTVVAGKTVACLDSWEKGVKRFTKIAHENVLRLIPMVSEARLARRKGPLKRSAITMLDPDGFYAFLLSELMREEVKTDWGNLISAQIDTFRTDPNAGVSVIADFMAFMDVTQELKRPGYQPRQ